MLATMKRLHVIRGLDFTGVWFAPPILRARWPNEELSAPPRLLTQDRTLVPGNDLHRYDQGWDGLARQMIFLDESDYTVITGIQFDGVQFHNAHLGPVMFVADTFSKVSFDSANLAQARFDRSVFDDGTTFESFVLEFEGARSFDRIAGSVYFGNCEFSIRRLMPRPLRRTGSFDDAIARDDTGHVIDALRGPGWTADHVAVRIEDSSASHFQRSAELLSGVLNRSDSDVRLGLESFGGQRLALVYGGSIRSDIDVARRLAEQVVKTSRAYHP